MIQGNGQGGKMHKAEAVAAVVLGAGKGTRMKSDMPKVMHPIGGRPMIRVLMDSIGELAPERCVVVTAPGMQAVRDCVAPADCVTQSPALGTAHAVAQARPVLEGFGGTVLVLYGDTPLVTAETMRAMVARRRQADDPAVVVLGFCPEDPGAYGRLIGDDDGNLHRIVEYKDAGEAERAIRLCNSGVVAVDGRILFDLLDAVGNDNASGEYYLTDIVAIARERGRVCAYIEGAADEVLGINSHLEQAAAEAIYQNRLREAAMRDGVTMIAPETVFLSHDTRFGRDVVIEPHVVIGPGVRIGDKVHIKAFSHLEQAEIGEGAAIGPYGRLRPGAEIGQGAKIGNFVEVKKAVIEPGAKVSHLTYIGDARVGAGANIGAGTITCNYDGYLKSFTDIGAGAFIGSNSSLVAPVKIGEGAIVGAGSVITHDVPADALAVTRAEEKRLPRWAARFRKRRQAEKDKAGGNGQGGNGQGGNG